jgi:tRNA(fMet)-specific endonuclease VapC
LAITIITVDEILRGWYAQIRRAKDDERIARAYESLQQAVEFTNGVRILPFDLPSIQRFHGLRKTHRRVGTNDLRIAAIVLQHKGVLVTRNTPDYADIEGLTLENWA